MNQILLIPLFLLLLLCFYLWHKLSLSKQNSSLLESKLIDLTSEHLKVSGELEQVQFDYQQSKSLFAQQETELATLKNTNAHLQTQVEQQEQKAQSHEQKLEEQRQLAGQAQLQASLGQEKINQLEKEKEQLAQEYQDKLNLLKQQQQEQLLSLEKQQKERFVQLQEAYKQQEQATKEQLEAMQVITNQNLKIMQEKLENATSKLVQGTYEKNIEQFKTITNPFKEKLEEFNKRTNDLLEKNLQNDSKFATQIETFDKQIEKIHAQADNLSNALRGSVKKLGNWGEQQLAVLLESVGLIRGTHFALQPKFKSAAGNSLQPDCVLNLPNGRKIIIDSKTTLNAYYNAYNAKTKEEETLEAQKLVKNIESHINDLKSKEYQKLPELNSLDFVLMYIPIDNVLSYIAQTKPEVFLEAQKANIAIVTNSTLFPLLTLIDSIWQSYEQSNNVRKLIEWADKFFARMGDIAILTKKVGDNLSTTNNNFNKLLSRLVSNSGALRRVEKFSSEAKKAGAELDKLQPLATSVEQQSLNQLDNFIAQLPQEATADFYADVVDEAELEQEQGLELGQEQKQDLELGDAQEQDLELGQEQEQDLELDQAQDLELGQEQEQALELGLDQDLELEQAVLAPEPISYTDPLADPELAAQIQSQMANVSAHNEANFFAEYDQIFAPFDK